MFRLLASSLPALALCLGAAHTAGAAPLEALWETPDPRLPPVVEPGILPGGCYVPGGTVTGPSGCPSGWCATGYSPAPRHSPASDCPNGFGDVAPGPRGERAAPFVGSRPGAVRAAPVHRTYRRPSPEFPWPESAEFGMFEADSALPADYLHEHPHDSRDHRRPQLRPRFNPQQRQLPGDFHILPVNEGISNCFFRETPLHP